MTERHSVGEHRVSLTILRKTTGDLLVSQHSMERWFNDEAMAVRALQDVAAVFIESEAEADRREASNHNPRARKTRPKP